MIDFNDLIPDETTVKKGMDFDDLIPSKQELDAFFGLTDPNKVEKRAKSVLEIADKFEVPITSVVKSYDQFSDMQKVHRTTAGLGPIWDTGEDKRTMREILGYPRPKKIPVNVGRTLWEIPKGLVRFFERGVGGTSATILGDWLGQFIHEGGVALDWFSKLGTKDKDQVYNPIAQSIMTFGTNLSAEGKKGREQWAYAAATGWEALDEDLRKKDPISYGAGRLSEGVASSALSVLSMYLFGGAAAPELINKGVQINRGLVVLSSISAAGAFEHAQREGENFYWATLHGLVDGMMEYAMESTFLEGVGKGTSKLTAGAKEGLEEFFTGMFQNTRAGILENANKGMTAYDSAKDAVVKSLKQSPWEVAGGFIGGFGIAGGSNLVQLYEQSKPTQAEKLAKGLKVPKEVAEEAVTALMEGKTVAEVDKTIITPAKVLGVPPEVPSEVAEITPEPITPEKAATEAKKAAIRGLKPDISEGIITDRVADLPQQVQPRTEPESLKAAAKPELTKAKEISQEEKIKKIYKNAIQVVSDAKGKDAQHWRLVGEPSGEITLELDDGQVKKPRMRLINPSRGEIKVGNLSTEHKQKLQTQIEKWALEAPPTPAAPPKAKAPVEQLGGLPEAPPGLTKPEVEHLGRREQTALRSGQRLGLKIGYKKGYQEAALSGRRKLNTLRMDVAISKKSKEDLRGVIQQFVPKEEQHRFMTRLSRVKDVKGVQKITGEIEHFIEQFEHRAAVRHFKRFVSGIKSKYKSGEVAFGQLPNNLRDKVMSVVDAYDAARLSTEKAEDLIAHKGHIQKVAGSIADAFREWENLDEQGLDILQLPNYRIRELQRLEKTPVADLGIDEIEFIQNELESLLATNERKGQIKARIRAERLHTHITGASNEIHTRGETKAGEIKQPGYAKRFIGIEQAQLRTLTGFATKQKNEHTVNLLVDQLYEANRKRAANYKDFILYTREQRVKRGITNKDFDDLGKSVTVTLGGKEITITQDSLLSLWMDTEAEGNMRRLLGARGHNLISDKNKPIRVGKITLQEIQEALSKLSDKTKSIGELAFDVNFKKQAPALNETWMKLYNYPLARHERHWPFPRELEKLVEGPRAEISLSMEMQGRYQRRTGGNARHKVIPFTKQFMMGLQMDAATAAMTSSMQEAKALLANKKWRSRMKDSGQQPAMNAITTMLRRSQGLVSDQSVADLIAAKFLGKAGKSLLSARPSGMLIQTASISAGYETIEPKYFMNLAVPTPSAIKELKELSPALWLRWEAKQFDYALGAAAAQSGFRTLIEGKQPITDRLVNHYTWGDQIAIYYGWTAAQNKVAAETEFRKGTPEFTNASLDLLHRWLETQPQWDILNRTLLTSHPSPWLRGSMMFMSARNAQYNVMLRAYDDYAKGRIDAVEFSTRIGGVVQANITVELARRLFRFGVKAAALGVLFGLRPDDRELVKEIAKEEAVKDIKKVPLESALNMFGLMAFGQIASTIGREAVKQIEGKTFPKKLSEARTGNIIADFTLDFTQFGILSAKLAKEILTGEVYVDRKRMGEAKWKDTALDLVNVAAEIVAMITGTPYSGPRSDIVWPTKTVLRGMSKDEYEKMRKELNKLRRDALQELVKEVVENE